MKFRDLTPTEFENLVFDLLVTLGLENAVWRTPGRDGGRDIEGSFSVLDLSGYRQIQKWYVECKKYETAVDWPTVWEKISYAQVQNADFLLFATTSSLSPQAVDQVNKWNQERFPRVRFWNGHEILRLLAIHSLIAIKYGLCEKAAGSPIVAFSELSLLALKFTNAAYSRAIFSGHESMSLEAAAALADLVLRRIESATKKWIPEPTRPEDVYEWISISSIEALQRFDRFGWRAFFAVLRAMQRAQVLEMVPTNSGVVIKLENEVIESHKCDLRCLAVYADFEIHFSEKNININAR